MQSHAHMLAALNQLNASWWVSLCASWFGRKSLYIEGNSVVVISVWRGKAYMEDYIPGVER